MQEKPAGPSVIVNKKSKVDLITLGKGEGKNLLVWFFPAGASDELKAARLQRRNFRLSLKCAEKKGYSKQRFSKIIQVFVISFGEMYYFRLLVTFAKHCLLIGSNWLLGFTKDGID